MKILNLVKVTQLSKINQEFTICELCSTRSNYNIFVSTEYGLLFSNHKYYLHRTHDHALKVASRLYNRYR